MSNFSRESFSILADVSQDNAINDIIISCNQHSWSGSLEDRLREGLFASDHFTALQLACNTP